MIYVLWFQKSEKLRNESTTCIGSGLIVNSGERECRSKNVYRPQIFI